MSPEEAKLVRLHLWLMFAAGFFFGLVSAGIAFGAYLEF